MELDNSRSFSCLKALSSEQLQDKKITCEQMCLSLHQCSLDFLEALQMRRYKIVKFTTELRSI